MMEKLKVGDLIDVRRSPIGVLLTQDQVQALPWEPDEVRALCNRGCCVFDSMGVQRGEATFNVWWRRRVAAAISGADLPEADASRPCPDTDDQLVARSLDMYANWIETHRVETRDVLTSARDVASSEVASSPRELTSEQHRLVDRLRKLSSVYLSRRPW